jgi:hypothetical protein
MTAREELEAAQREVLGQCDLLEDNMYTHTHKRTHRERGGGRDHE